MRFITPLAIKAAAMMKGTASKHRTTKHMAAAINTPANKRGRATGAANSAKTAVQSPLTPRRRGAGLPPALSSGLT